jgi:hypothetical protein
VMLKSEPAKVKAKGKAVRVKIDLDKLNKK